ncbi:methyl-accepting chemotaxis protein, partial [Actinoplanes nipponensis]
MSRLTEMGIAKRLTLIVLVGVLALTASAIITMQGQNRVVGQSDRLTSLESCRGALNHLDTRQSELKVDAYRSALKQDVTQDVVDDVASATEAADAVEACGLYGPLAAEFGTIRPNVNSFGTFIADFVRQALAGGASAPDTAQIAERNSAVDDQLGALNEKVVAEIERQRVEMDDAVGDTKWAAWIVGVVGLLLLIALSVPLARSILRPVQRLGQVIAALAEGDLTQRSGITTRDELGRMAVGLDTALAAIHRSLTTIGQNAETLASSATELSAVAGQIATAAHDTDAQTSSASNEAEEISRNVQTVAAGSEEMGLSIREISRNTSEAAQIAAIAVAEAAQATETVRQLGESSAEIGNVIKLITSIA